MRATVEALKRQSVQQLPQADAWKVLRRPWTGVQVGGRCWDCGDPPCSPGVDASPSHRPWQKPASFPPHELPHRQADIQRASLQQCCCCIREISNGGRSIDLQELTPPSQCSSRVRVRLANKQLQVNEICVPGRQSDICTPSSVWQE